MHSFLKRFLIGCDVMTYCFISQVEDSTDEHCGFALDGRHILRQLCVKVWAMFPRLKVISH